MLALSFASVPLYRLFCQKTGFGGTPKIGSLPPGMAVGKRKLTIRFNADVRDLPWEFKPLQSQITGRAGEQLLAFYHAKNLSSQDYVGMAMYNVVPEKAGPYFNKIDCFCFLEQKFTAHQSTDLPVLFYIDTAIEDDPNMKEVDTITLSYTFFQLKS
jgi:cytochrome c oxidase assembly protein subunit 11